MAKVFKLIGSSQRQQEDTGSGFTEVDAFKISLNLAQSDVTEMGSKQALKRLVLFLYSQMHYLIKCFSSPVECLEYLCVAD